TITVVRETEPVSVTFKIGEMPSDETAAAEAPEADEWGLSVEALTGDAALRLDLGVTRGLLVTDVQPGSAAEKAGLKRGDVILELDRKPIDDPTRPHQALGALKPGESVLIYVHRVGSGA